MFQYACDSLVIIVARELAKARKESKFRRQTGTVARCIPFL
jgi:hypothetical protein